MANIIYPKFKPIIEVSSSRPALRVYQNGTGASLFVGDQKDDASGFIVDSDGNVGIGYNSGSSVAYKLSVSGSGHFTSDVYIHGTASINTLNTINQNSLVVGDKYITLMSGATDHDSLSGSGILWGSGSVEDVHASIKYDGDLDKLILSPGIVSDSITGSFSGSFIGTASYAQNANLLDNLNSTQFAITSSNIFTGDQTISASLYVSGASSIDVSSSSPALRVTQRGTGQSFIVEDSTNPDSDLFRIDNNGVVGVGIAINDSTPGGYKLYVNGNGYFVGSVAASDIIQAANQIKVNSTVGFISASNFSGSAYTASNGFYGRAYGTSSYSLDSDKLDGIDSSEFVLKTEATSSLVRLAANNIFTGIQTVTGSLFINTSLSSSQITGSFSGNGSGLTEITPSSAAGGILSGTYPNPSGLSGGTVPISSSVIFTNSGYGKNISFRPSGSVDITTSGSLSGHGNITLQSNFGKIDIKSQGGSGGQSGDITLKAQGSLPSSIFSNIFINSDTGNNVISLGTPTTAPNYGSIFVDCNDMYWSYEGKILIGANSTKLFSVELGTTTASNSKPFIKIGATKTPIKLNGPEIRTPTIVYPTASTTISVDSPTLLLLPTSNITMSAKPAIEFSNFYGVGGSRNYPNGVRVTLTNASNNSIAFSNDTSVVPTAEGGTFNSSSLKLGANERVIKPWGVLELQYQALSGSNAGYWVETNFSNNLTGSTDISNYPVLTSNNIFTGNQTITGSLFINTSLSSSQITGSMSGSLLGTASYAQDSNLLDGLDSSVFARTGSSNNFTANNVFTTITGSGISGSFFYGDGSNLTNVSAVAGTVFVNGNITGSGAIGNPIRTTTNITASAFTASAGFNGNSLLITGSGADLPITYLLKDGATRSSAIFTGETLQIAGFNQSNGCFTTLRARSAVDNADMISYYGAGSTAGLTIQGASNVARIGTSTNHGFSIDTSATQRIHVQSGGNVAVSGNIIFPNGNGINFGAVAGSNSTSNVLDDYEEGTWTPVVATGLGPTFVNSVGTYTKIGNIVNLYARFTTGGSATTGIGGIPYICTASGSANVTNIPNPETVEGAFINGDNIIRTSILTNSTIHVLQCSYQSV